MTDDLLSRATRALRDEPSDVEAEGAPTLLRIERSLRGRTAERRRVRRLVVLPLAAAFLVIGAWASASGQLARWFAPAHEDDERREHAFVPEPSEAPAKPQIMAPSARTDPWALPSVLPSATEPRAPESAPKVVPPSPDALYRAAHEAHFVKKDPSAALVAWDRYLAASGPTGRFTLEARYNRAIALVRLGRRAEAAAALRPFADGEYGAYRREEARELLSTLREP